MAQPVAAAGIREVSGSFVPAPRVTTRRGTDHVSLVSGAIVFNALVLVKTGEHAPTDEVLHYSVALLALFFGIMRVMPHIATVRAVRGINGLALFAPGRSIAHPPFDHVQQRMHNLLNPSGGQSAYKLQQALFGLAAGDVVGSGLGAGRPEPQAPIRSKPKQSVEADTELVERPR